MLYVLSLHAFIYDWVPLNACQPVLHRNVSCTSFFLGIIREDCYFPRRNVQEGSKLALADKQPVAPATCPSDMYAR